jgi:serine/threonine-protein kinase
VTASPTILGRYALFDEIAAGGMATVHLGRLLGPVGFSRTVAIKRLHGAFARDAEVVAMLADEARLAGRIHHPNVVATLDVVSTGSDLLLVMEYVHGESLARLMKGGAIPVGVAASVLAGTLHGLHAAHEATSDRGQPLGIVHRDVSPQNILVGTDGIARVADFGVAKATGRLQTTRAGQLKGKLAYMAPEQLSGAPLDRRVDVYAAGVVLWEALTGQRLFAREEEAETFRRILSHDPEPPSRLAPGVPAHLDAIALKALARDPRARFDTARDMAIALEEAVELPRAHEVGEWVAVAANLGSREARLAEIQEASIVTEGTPAQVSVEAPLVARSERRGQVWIGALVGVAVAFTVAGLTVRATRRPVPASSTPDLTPRAEDSTSPVPLPPPLQSAPPAPVSAAPTPAPLHTHRTPRAPAASAPSLRAPSIADCDPPFTIDSAGVKIPKRQCLGKE